MQPSEAKQHILISTINAIEKYGLHNLTTRLIADEAGVNNAGLHYHFGTKENLIEIALKQTIQHFEGDVIEMLNAPKPLREKLMDVMEHLIGGGVRFPNLIRAHFFAPLMSGETGGPMSVLFNDFMKKLYDEIYRLMPERDSTELKYALLNAMTGGMFNGMAPAFFVPYMDLDLRDDVKRAGYVNYLVDVVMGK